MTAVQADRDLDLHLNVLRKWVVELAADLGSAFPGHGQLKPESQELERLRRENAKLKAERDILKKRPPTSRGTRYEVRLHREAPGDLAGVVALRGARCLAQWFSCMAVARAERADAE